MIFASNSPCKSYENEQNPYFSDFECNFRLLGGVFHKCSKSKYHRFRQNNFLAPILAVKNTLFTFFCFFSPLHAIFFPKKDYIPILGELRKIHAKIYTIVVVGWSTQLYWLTRSVFHSLRLDVTLCRNSPLTVVLLEAGIKVWCNPWITWPPKPIPNYPIVPSTS